MAKKIRKRENYALRFIVCIIVINSQITAHFQENYKRSKKKKGTKEGSMTKNNGKYI